MSNRKEAGMSPELERVRKDTAIAIADKVFRQIDNNGEWFTGPLDVAARVVEPYLAEFERLVREEVQRQTGEAAAKIAHDEGDYFIERAIRALLSPAQEVRNG